VNYYSHNLFYRKTIHNTSTKRFQAPGRITKKALVRASAGAVVTERYSVSGIPLYEQTKTPQVAYMGQAISNHSKILSVLRLPIPPSPRILDGLLSTIYIFL
jgi:hypothetical protein